MTSKQRSAYVWIWLPGASKPCAAGKLGDENNQILFNYGQKYLDKALNHKAISIFEPELPLQKGILPLAAGLTMPNCIRDASPDAWGRRVILNKLLGQKGNNADTATLGELTYLLASGSDRIGALDFQASPTTYRSRKSEQASLEELLNSAQRVEKGIPLSTTLDKALLHGSSIGGARPKALIESNGIKYIAKFSLSTDIYNIIKAEFIAMRLAKLVGLNVANVQLTKACNKDVLLIERFDRVHTTAGYQRKHMLSALTLLGLNEMMARYASYETLTEIIRHQFTEPKKTLHELFSRLVFNILCGNTDDHARNHAAFYDGKKLTLTPAYDICPQSRTGGEASQAMLIIGNNNLSQLSVCLKAAQNFQLKQQNALEIFSEQMVTIEKNWHNVCEEAQLNVVDRNYFWQRQFLNPFSIVK